MVFKDLQDGATKQSADTFAEGTTVIVTTLAVANNVLLGKSTVINGKLITAQKGNLNLEVYEMSGKLVRSFKAVSNGNAIDLNLTKNGLYLLKITNETHREVVKFAK